MRPISGLLDPQARVLVGSLRRNSHELNFEWQAVHGPRPLQGPGAPLQPGPYTRRDLYPELGQCHAKDAADLGPGQIGCQPLRLQVLFPRLL